MWRGKPGHFPVRIQSARWSLIYSIRLCRKNVPTTLDVDVVISSMLPQIVAENLFATEPSIAIRSERNPQSSYGGAVKFARNQTNHFLRLQTPQAPGPALSSTY